MNREQIRLVRIIQFCVYIFSFSISELWHNIWTHVTDTFNNNNLMSCLLSTWKSFSRTPCRTLPRMPSSRRLQAGSAAQLRGTAVPSWTEYPEPKSMFDSPLNGSVTGLMVIKLNIKSSLLGKCWLLKYHSKMAVDM